MQRFCKPRRITSTSLQTSLPRLRTITPAVVKDYNDPVKKEDVLMVDATPTTEPEGGLLDAFRTVIQKRFLKKYCRIFDAPLQELFDTLEMECISVQIDLLATGPPYNIHKRISICLAQNTMFSQSNM